MVLDAVWSLAARGSAPVPFPSLLAYVAESKNTVILSLLPTACGDFPPPRPSGVPPRSSMDALYVPPASPLGSPRRVHLLHLPYHPHPSRSIICPCPRRPPLWPLPHHPCRSWRWRPTYRGRPYPPPLRQRITYRRGCQAQTMVPITRRGGSTGGGRWISPHTCAYVPPTYRRIKKLRVIIINKDVRKSLARKNGNDIII